MLLIDWFSIFAIVSGKTRIATFSVLNIIMIAIIMEVSSVKIAI